MLPQHEFQGQILHTSSYTTGKMFSGRRVLVVGACTSGTCGLLLFAVLPNVKLIHDICRSRCCTGFISAGSGNHDAAAQVYVRNVGAEWNARRYGRYVVFHFLYFFLFFLASNHIISIGIYAEGGPPVDIADQLSASLPLKVVKSIQQRATKIIKTLDQYVNRDIVTLRGKHYLTQCARRALLNDLEKVGFKLNYGVDGSGALILYDSKTLIDVRDCFLPFVGEPFRAGYTLEEGLVGCSLQKGLVSLSPPCERQGYYLVRQFCSVQDVGSADGCS
jgi:hypothetical protein